MATSSPFGTAAVPALNPITAQIPNFAQQSMQAARQQAMAQALLQEGMAPIDYDNRGRISWTQGLAKMLNAYVGSKMGNDAINQQAGLQTQGMQAQGQALGMGQPSPGSNAMSQGAQQGSIGPTNDNAGRLAASLSPAQKQNVNGAVMPTPYNPQGLPPQLLMSAQYGDPVAKAQLDTLLKNFEQTPEIKNNNAFGITPEQAKAMALAEATKKGFQSFTPGESWTNTFTGQGGFAPKLPENTQPNAPFTPGSPIPSVGVVPGTQPAIMGNARATATGTTAGTPHTVTNPDGSSTVGLGGDVFQIPPAQQARENAEAVRIMRQERANPNNSPETNAGLDREIARMSGGRTITGPNLSAKGTTEKLVDNGNQLLTQAQKAQEGNGQARTFLNEMEQLNNSGAKFGPGTGDIARFKALANNYVPGIDLTGAQTAQDVMHKLAASLAGSSSPRSDADLANWQARYPNGELTNQAIKELIPLLRNQLSLSDARSNVISRASSAGLDKLPDLANRFNQIATPTLTAEGQQMAQASKAGQVQQFVQQYQKSHPQDWQQRLGQIQQLDMMGAF